MVDDFHVQNEWMLVDEASKSNDYNNFDDAKATYVTIISSNGVHSLRYIRF